MTTTYQPALQVTGLNEFSCTISDDAQQRRQHALDLAREIKHADTSAERDDAVAAASLLAGQSLGAAHGSAIDAAHQWLQKSRQEWNGHISTWTPEQMDNYHRDLGLLVDFVTDCWPNGESSDLRP